MSSSKQVIAAANGANPSPVLNNLIVANGQVYLAGMLGMDAAGKLVPGGCKAETVQALKNASEKLAHVGLDLGDVVSITIFVNDYATNLPLLNEVYASCFPDPAGLPVRAAVGVAALPLGAALELSIIAVTRS